MLRVVLLRVAVHIVSQVIPIPSIKVPTYVRAFECDEG